MEKYFSVNGQRQFGRCSQLRYVSTPYAVGRARRYCRRDDEIKASFSIEEAAGGVHGGDKSSVSDAKFVVRLGCKYYIGSFCCKFERSWYQESSFVVALKAALRCC